MPLYYGRDEDGMLWVASEMKAIEPRCSQVQTFPPGHVLDSNDGRIERWYQPAGAISTGPTNRQMPSNCEKRWKTPFIAR